MTTSPTPLQALPTTLPPLPPLPPPGPGYSFPNPAPSEEESRRHAFQYVGLPGYASWLSSSNDFFVLRRFSQLNARYLLYLQHEIAKRENELAMFDNLSRDRPVGKGPNGSFEYEEFQRRADLLKDVGPLLKEYYDLVNAFAQVRSKGTATSHHIQNIENWFASNPDAIIRTEQHHLKPEVMAGDRRPLDGDLFPVMARTKSPLRWLLHKSQKLRVVFQLPGRSDRVTGPGTQYHSDVGFDNMVCAITVIFGLVLLFAPMWSMHYVDKPTEMLGTITGFVTLFAFWLWVAAGPRQFEILLGTAAYAAVLYIYLQAASGPSNVVRRDTPSNSSVF